MENDKHKSLLDIELGIGIGSIKEEAKGEEETIKPSSVPIPISEEDATEPATIEEAVLIETALEQALETKEIEQVPEDNPDDDIFIALEDAMKNYDWSLVHSTETKTKERGRRNFRHEITGIFTVAERKDRQRAAKIWNKYIRPPYTAVAIFIKSKAE